MDILRHVKKTIRLATLSGKPARHHFTVSAGALPNLAASKRNHDGFQTPCLGV